MSASLQPCEKQPRKVSTESHSVCTADLHGRSDLSIHAQINVPLVCRPVLFHDVLERPQKVFLESEVGQLPLLQKLHGQLPERVHGENRHIFVGITANLCRYKTCFSNITAIACPVSDKTGDNCDRYVYREAV